MRQLLMFGVERQLEKLEKLGDQLLSLRDKNIK